jgi:transcriptional regulator with XRE-family HTH domain
LIENLTILGISERLRALLDLLKKGDQEFADSINIDQSQFSKIKRGKLSITLKQIMEISSYYKVRTGWLLEGEEPIFKEHSKEQWEVSYKGGNKIIKPAQREPTVFLSFSKDDYDLIKSSLETLSKVFVESSVSEQVAQATEVLPLGKRYSHKTQEKKNEQKGSVSKKGT